MSYKNPTPAQRWGREKFVLRGQLKMIRNLANYMLNKRIIKFPYLRESLSVISVESNKALNKIDSIKTYSEHIRKKEGFHDSK